MGRGRLDLEVSRSHSTHRGERDLSRSELTFTHWCVTMDLGSCPVCRRPISLWVQIPSRWKWEEYWTREIERMLTDLGPQERGEYHVGREWRQVYQRLVNERCVKLSVAELAEATEVMEKACKGRGRVAEHIHGVDDEGEPTLIIRASDGVWDYHEAVQRLWLFAWGPVHRVQLARRGRSGADRRHHH